MAKRKAKFKSMPSPETACGKSDDEWRVSSALDTIMRAQEHIADKPLMKRIKTLAQTKRERLQRIARLEKAKL
ncbi:MAG: hypothetical protein AABZ67_00650 [Pseudomonadota bacterium]